MILDEQAVFADGLRYSFQQLGYTVQCESNLQHALDSCIGAHTEIVIAELRISGVYLLDHLETFKKLSPRARLVIVTAQPSIASAICAIRLGVDAYLAKPATAALVLQNLQQVAQNARPDEPQSWPSLDRTIWEYLNSVFVAAGSMSEAARRLGLDRRSLRRMLAKHPPPR